ncbi:MAG: hypothetical protein ABF746_08600 [Acetobacter orientalis]|uniref:hypothetical protein n=1 Tax=Acetobacter orientalis TaxID=146474 RepID=UPI0039EA6105
MEDSMVAVSRIVFVPYVLRQRGKKKVLEAGTPIQCRTEADALRWIDKVQTGTLSAVGGQAVKMTVDEDAGEYGEPEYLASAGNVPETLGD